ncbi:ParA family protein [Ignatzschineria cameli]|uniref:Chromosome partitioning protein n=1 Tax=Ignatzschineria cameli TaxID=2182793 RepID=A0A2U2AR00_9GAMM|nr:ParA family protein [Ignatzschineria cameli]PWD85254.1 chromosome partitioning protein [Ignatzschineria cameli]PWD86321.1 chromosome partitioning protein [Ignatzschineria cameli]PWD89841.1 chromosome partitioning protein [Ignatzschineria cameli]PWD91491.1 chromosome partitioning protein [Ignatzschineria cameli]PWD92529.1 chromosome partitioning protein [Ignatzschineria cameli]
MATIIAVANQKGGVGKTTTAVNLASSLTESKMRPNVLLIDLDPQGNATTGIGVNKNELESSVVDLLLGEASIADVILDLDKAGLRLIGANADLTGAEVMLAQAQNGIYKLKEILAPIGSNFDYIVLDCAPSLNMLTLNALTAATDIVIPVQCEYYALEGISALMDTISTVKEATNPDLNIMGVLRTMFDGRNTLSVQVSENLAAHFGDKMFESIVPRNVRLAEAPGYGVPITVYDAKSKGAMAYTELAREVISRSKKR